MKKPVAWTMTEAEWIAERKAVFAFYRNGAGKAPLKSVMLEHLLVSRPAASRRHDRPDTAEAAKEAWMDQERLDERMRFLVNGAETQFSPDRFWKVARDARKGELGATPAERRENQDRILRPGVRPS